MGRFQYGGYFPIYMDAARIAMYGAAAFTIVLVGAVIYDEFAPPPAPDNAQVVADFCLGDHSNIGVHYHPIIEIVINGQQVTIPANTGINHDGCSMRGVHTHDSSGKIHIEMDKKYNVPAESFFIIWGETFNENQILDYVVDDNHEIVVTLDGERVNTYEDTVIEDQEVLRIEYRAK